MTGAVIVFVETAKELPAALIMRPFNFDTLAVQTYRLAAAFTASLVIVAVGLIPVIMLSRAIQGRAQRRDTGETPILSGLERSAPA